MINAIRRCTIDFEPMRGRWLNGFSWRTRAFELSIDRKRILEVELSVIKFDDHWSLHTSILGLSLYLHLPFEVKSEPEDMLDKWGLSTGALDSVIPEDIVFEWGPKISRRIYMPWMWDFYKHEVRLKDGTWAPSCKGYPKTDGRYIEAHPYSYLRQDGTTQSVSAQVYAERREWRWRALKFLPFPRMIRTEIAIEFSEGVGEGVDTWKGGCTGCGWPLKPSQSMEQALRDMESKRTFRR